MSFLSVFLAEIFVEEFMGGVRVPGSESGGSGISLSGSILEGCWPAAAIPFRDGGGTEGSGGISLVFTGGGGKGILGGGGKGILGGGGMFLCEGRFILVIFGFGCDFWITCGELGGGFGGRRRGAVGLRDFLTWGFQPPPDPVSPYATRDSGLFTDFDSEPWLNVLVWLFLIEVFVGIVTVNGGWFELVWLSFVEVFGFCDEDVGMVSAFNGVLLSSMIAVFVWVESEDGGGGGGTLRGLVEGDVFNVLITLGAPDLISSRLIFGWLVSPVSDVWFSFWLFFGNTGDSLVNFVSATSAVLGIGCCSLVMVDSS